MIQEEYMALLALRRQGNTAVRETRSVRSWTKLGYHPVTISK